MDSYLSYLRNMFGAGHHGQPQPRRPTHSRSQSATTPAYAYAQQRPSTAPARPRANSYAAPRSTRPSPLRYDSHQPHPTIPVDPRPSVKRHGSHGAVHYPYFASSTSRSAYSTPASSRSNSSTSLHPGFPHSAAPVPKPAKRVRYADERPPLKQNHSWHPGSASAHAPIHAPLNMHPLLAHTRFHHAPISYDVVYTPSARTVVDSKTREAVPTHTLTQPATEPPLSTASQLVLTSDRFPWAVVVGASNSKSRCGSGSGAISNLDVLYALHATLLTRVTPGEWEALGRGSRAQRRVTRAYEKRCARMGGGWEGGVRRVDWLGEKTRLVGVEMDKSRGGAVGRLVFEKA